jgi:hypothetical protein
MGVDVRSIARCFCYIDVHVCRYAYVLNEYVCVRAHMCACIPAHIHTQIHTYMYVQMHIYIYIYIWIIINTHTHTHPKVHIHTHTHTHSRGVLNSCYYARNRKCALTGIRGTKSCQDT